uniref:NADH-ubiquinone oxidoreductase chain 3 n=1 Tax=Balamuthia mandrillaris TaxID=66527 RepID=A0A0K1HSK8_9EUKA|nr:NADH dehydrogenase subunit 3 [Balamuthia mandrillaris]AKT94902.1 NADH dehydrogenase subunit 3 [Balamuthia mandrillaris]
MPFFLSTESTVVLFYHNLEFTKIAYFIFFFLVLSVILFFASFFIIFQQEDIEKISAYECGFQPFEDTRVKFDVRYYLVGILFLIFDLEIMFLFPWSVAFLEMGLFSYFVIFVFIGLLFVAFFYEWFKGALLWE